jgi:hypothetical protein
MTANLSADAPTDTVSLAVRSIRAMADGERADPGMSRQLAWVPPTPAYLLKMAAAKRRARRG